MSAYLINNYTFINPCSNKSESGMVKQNPQIIKFCGFSAYRRVSSKSNQCHDIKTVRRHDLLNYAAVNIILVLLFWTLKRCSETGFNYVRLRELIMAIESAHILQCEARRSGLESGPFDDIKGLACHFSKTNCKIGCKKCQTRFSSKRMS